MKTQTLVRTRPSKDGGKPRPDTSFHLHTGYPPPPHNIMRVVAVRNPIKLLDYLLVDINWIRTTCCLKRQVTSLKLRTLLASNLPSHFNCTFISGMEHVILKNVDACTVYYVKMQERPYIMLRHGKNYTGNNRFYGFAMDLLEEVARISQFSYIVDLNPDGAYGVRNPVTGEWNGIVKQLMQHVSFFSIRLIQLFTNQAISPCNERSVCRGTSLSPFN